MAEFDIAQKTHRDDGSATLTSAAPVHASSGPAPTPSFDGPAGPLLSQGAGHGSVAALQTLFGGMFDHGPPSAPSPSAAVPAPSPQAATASGTPATNPAEQDKQKQVDEAVSAATKKLSYGVGDWVLTDADARQAMTTLKGLPPELQGEAVKKLDPTTFSRLLAEVPEKDREQFQSLVDNCHDPARKLELFAATHKSRVSNDAQRLRAAAPGDKNADVRDAIVANTQKEVDDEVAFLRQKVKDGKLSETDVQKYIDSKTSEHQAEMRGNTNQIGTLDGLPDADRVDYVKQSADKLLSRSSTDWAVTDKEARKALDMLTGLPPGLQGQAIKNLDKDAFENLISEVPETDHARFKTLLDNCPDPERKLKLWGQYHIAKVKADAAREKEKTKDEGSILGQTAAQKENQRQNKRRDEIVDSTKDEVKDEVDFLLKQKEKGGPLTMAEVDQLMERKDLESQVEMKHLINLTHELDKDPAKRATWSKGELQDVMATLDKLPAEHVRKNPHLEEIQRRLKKPDNKAVADHQSGHINFYGLSTGDQAGVPHHRMGHLGVPVIQGTLTHEIGHNLHDYKYAEQFGAIKQQAGWDSHFFKPDESPNRVVMKNPYGFGYVSYEKGTIPETAAAGDWGYGRSNEKDHFAEMYTKMVNLPTETRRDMVDEPNRLVAGEQAKYDLADQNVTALAASGLKPGDASFDLAVKQRDAQQAKLDQAKNNARRLKSQYDTMHDQVVGP